MRVTNDYLQKKFAEFNKLFFANELPPINICTGKSGSALGSFSHPKNEITDYGKCKIIISNRYDRDEKEIEDTILHEMIHYFILHNKIKDTSPHGKIFKKIMDQINRNFARNINISNKLDQNQISTDTSCKIHCICVLYFNNGIYGLVLPFKTRVFFIHNELKQIKSIKHEHWYIGDDPWFNRFKKSRNLKIYELNKNDFDIYIKHLPEYWFYGKYFMPKKS